MEKKDFIICPNCGFRNINGTRKCSKCRKDIDTLRKSCPKCGKINYNNVKYCVSCKFDFTKKRRSVLFNLIISLLIVGVLFLLVFFGKEGFVSKFNVGLKVLAGFSVFVLFVKTFTYGDKHIINYSAEEEIVEKQKKLISMKKWCNIAIIVGGILAFAFLVYYYIFR